MVFTAQQASAILVNSLKVSADGPISSHTDVEVASPEIGQSLKWDGSNWVNGEEPVSGPTFEQITATQINSTKISALPPKPLNILDDVSTSNVIEDDILVWDGENWVNRDRTCYIEICEEQSVAIVANTAKVSANGSVNSHDDVEAISSSLGSVQVWSGLSYWHGTNGNPFRTSYNLRTSLDPKYGDVLTWDGSNWVNRATIRFPIVIPVNLPSGVITDFPYNGMSVSGGAGPGPTWNLANRDLAAGFDDSQKIDISTPAFCSSSGWSSDQIASSIFFGTVHPSTVLLNGLCSMKSMDEMYVSMNPFPNNLQPTVSELMLWNVAVINRFRKLCGRSIPCVLDQRLCDEALWYTERDTTSFYGPIPRVFSYGDGSIHFSAFPPFNDLELQKIYPGIPSICRKSNWNSGAVTTQIVSGVTVSKALNLFVAESVPYAYHMCSIIRYLLYRETGDNGQQGRFRPSLINQMIYQDEIGMSITRLGTSIVYSFLFAGPVLSRCGGADPDALYPWVPNSYNALWN